MLIDCELEDTEEEIDALDIAVDELTRLETDSLPLVPPPLPQAVVNDINVKNTNIFIFFILTSHFDFYLQALFLNFGLNVVA
jgi:hypothetical protein